MTLGNWRLWCCLCGKTPAEMGTKTFMRMDQQARFLLEHFFTALTFEPPADIVLKICPNCDQFIKEMFKFSELCTRTHNLMLSIMNRHLEEEEDLFDIRLEFGIGRDEVEATALVEIVPNDLELEELLEEASSDGMTLVKDEWANSDIKGSLVSEIPSASPSLLPPSATSTATVTQYHQYDDLRESKQPFEPLIVRSERSKLRSSSKPKQTKYFSCTKCDETFNRKVVLNKHMREKHSNKIASPESMEWTFDGESSDAKELESKAAIRRLVVTDEDDSMADEESPNKFACPYCEKKFAKSATVHSHIRSIHTGLRPFVCEECGKTFSTKGGLKEHQITHSDEHPFQCPHCPKKFKNLPRLKVHEDIHNSTLYICPHCGLQLNTKRTLTMHMVVHSDEKKYKCQYCEAGFKRSKALKNHLILHTGLRPYGCPFCDKTFANGSNCRTHKRKAHPELLAEYEASGKEMKQTVNIPKLSQLKAQTANKTIEKTEVGEDAPDAVAESVTHGDGDQLELVVESSNKNLILGHFVE